MWDLKVCLVCFTMDVKLYSMDDFNLRHQYNLLTGLQVKKANGMPEYLCFECATYTKRFIKFRDKCHRANFALQNILNMKKQLNISYLPTQVVTTSQSFSPPVDDWHTPIEMTGNKKIKKHSLKAVDRNIIKNKPNLSYLNINKTHYEEIKFHWTKNNRACHTTTDIIPTVHCTTLTKEQMFEHNVKNLDLDIKQESMELSAELGIFTHASKDFGKSEHHTNENAQMSDDDAMNCCYDSDTEINEEAPKMICKEDNVDVEQRKKSNDADGSELNPEYATLYPIARNEAQAAVEIYKMLSNGKYKCDICGKPYYNENRLKVHLRMHDKHVSGNYWCELCNYYYKTDFLLRTHMTEKHMYKYVCKKCPEVNFDRTSAKQHYIVVHMQKRKTKKDEWELSRPSWLSNKGGKRIKGDKQLKTYTTRSGRKPVNLPEDFLLYTPVTHEEQYQLVLQRKMTRNYTDARFKCEMCYRGYREQETYDKHMRKHNPVYSGRMQCDMCKLHFKDTRKLYKHMNITHLFKYSCQMCSYVCYNRGQAHMHYRWHKNVTYSCPHCSKEFKKSSTRLTHIRIKHPSTNICNLCGHSFVSENGLYCHKQIAHSAEELETSAAIPVNTADPNYCVDCNIHFLNQAAFTTHLGSSNKHATTNQSIKSSRPRAAHGVKTAGRPRRAGGPSEILNNGVATATTCEICGKYLLNDVQARKHYESEHPGAEFLKRYMCDVCGHTTKQYANLMVHMRTHTNEKPYKCPHCDRRFSMPSNRDRHIVVHTGEKRYECQHCFRRFTQSSAVKLHIQTVHLKIPYAPWDKKNRKRRKELEGTSAPVSTVNPVTACLQPQPQKIILDQGDYLNAYITYNDE